LATLAATGLSASIPRDSHGLTVEVPSQIPQTVSDVVDRDFAGLAFEQSSWVRYALNDNGEKNEFSANLMDAIYSRTGGTPIIRLGGTSPDYGRYLPGQEEPALPVAEQDNYQDIGGTTIGPTYWPIAKNFPEAKYMIQVPLATTNISESVAWAKAAVEGIGLDQIHSIQPGNEPDLYRDDFTGEDGVYLGPPNYQGTLDNATYVGNYTKYAAAIREVIDLPDQFFTAFDVAAHTDDHSVAEWLLQPRECFGLGIDRDNIIKEVSHHYYQNHAGEAEDLEEGLMTMSVTHGNLDHLKPRINWLKDNRPDLPFIINEVGNSLEPKNKYQYQARLGSALWAVDFYLYSLSIGVHRFNYQQIMHSGFDLWLPVASAGYQPQVFANFYSQPFVADFIGRSGQTRVSKLEVGGAGDMCPNLAVYAAYEGTKARRLAIANLCYWNRTSSEGVRPIRKLTLKLDDVDSVTVTHLSSPDGAGAGAETITYAGSQWSYESKGREDKGVRNDTEQVPVEDGHAVIDIPNSEAVIVYLKPRNSRSREWWHE
jgi:hypothetical protein